MPSARQVANVQPPPNPARGGNSRAVTHGAFSARAIGERAREIVAEVLAANEHLDPMRDGGAVCRYAETRARVERVYDWLNSKSDSVFDDEDAGTVHGVFERLERWERQCDAAEAHLAIAPLTLARLGLTVAAAFDLAKHWEQEGRGDG